MKRWRKAAEQNLAQAQQYDLGTCYAKGRGVAKDYVEAYKWNLLAAGQGHKPATYDMPMLQLELRRVAHFMVAGRQQP